MIRWCVHEPGSLPFMNRRCSLHSLRNLRNEASHEGLPRDAQSLPDANS